MLNSIGRMSRDEMGAVLCWKVLKGVISQLFDVQPIEKLLDTPAVLNRWQELHMFPIFNLLVI